MNSKNIVMTVGSLILVAVLIASVCIASPQSIDNGQMDNTSDEWFHTSIQITDIEQIETPNYVNHASDQQSDNTYDDIESSITDDPSSSGTPSQAPNKEKIDLSHRSPYISYNGLSEDAKIIISLMFETIKEYNGDSQFAEVAIPDRFHTYFSEELYCEIASFFVLYYGSFDHMHQYFNAYRYVQGGSTTYGVELRMKTIRTFETERVRYINYVESALSEMYDGTEIQILNQVAKWIAKNYTYRADANTIAGFFDNHEANCNVVAMLFRLFSECLGIPCDVVVGYSSVNGKYHAWTRVTLTDGSYRYYDITLYKSLNNSFYLCSTREMHNPVYVNKYIARNSLVVAFSADCAIANRDIIFLSDDKKKKKILLSVKESKL